MLRITKFSTGWASNDFAKTAIRAVTHSLEYPEIVAIECFQFELGPQPHFLIGDLLECRTLSKISQLTLDSLFAKENEILTIFRCMKGSIRLVEFRKIVMLSGDSWKSALRKLRELEYPSLKSFVLDTCDKPLRRRCQIEDYLLRMTEDNPLDPIA